MALDHVSLRLSLYIVFPGNIISNRALSIHMRVEVESSKCCRISCQGHFHLDILTER